MLSIYFLKNLPRKKVKDQNTLPMPALGVVENGARSLIAQRGVFRATKPILSQDLLIKIICVQKINLPVLWKTLQIFEQICLKLFKEK